MPAIQLGCRYPTAAEIDRLQMDLLPRYTSNRLAFELLPFRNTEMPRIQLQTPDIFRGLQQWRGLDKPTRHVGDNWNPFGSLRQIDPTYWGEHDDVSEGFLTEAASLGSCPQTVIDLTEIVTQKQMRLLERRYNRIEFNIWQALIFGKYEALAANGQVMFSARYNIQQVSAGIPWSDYNSSAPMADFRCIQLRGRGTSAKFDTCARAYMNRVTANCLFKNMNPNDVGKAALTACCTFMSQDMINQQFAAQGLPQISIYDEGYVDEDSNFYPYIPDGYVAIIGCRPGNEPVGNYWYTRNAVGCSISSGPWMKLVDTCDREVPRRITIFDGHNGGPVINYPRQIVVLRTGCTNNC